MTNHGSHGSFRWTDGLIRLGGRVVRAPGASRPSRGIFGPRLSCQNPALPMLSMSRMFSSFYQEPGPDIDAEGISTRSLLARVTRRLSNTPVLAAVIAGTAVNAAIN